MGFEERGRHRQIDPVGGRHQVDEPREIPVGDLRLAAGEELARFVRERRVVLGFAAGGGLPCTKLGNSSASSMRKATRSARCTQELS